MNGAAAAVGLTTSLTALRGGILIVSTSPRTGTSSKLNIGVGRMRYSVCRYVVGRTSVQRTVCAASVSKLSVISSRVSLINTRVRVLGLRSHRGVVGGMLTPVQSRCSCVLVSYSPSLNLVAVGTLATTSSIVVPIRYRCFTLRNVDGLLGAVGVVGSGLGPSLRVRNFLLAVFSSHLHLTGRVCSRIGHRFRRLMFGAVVRHGIGLDRTPDRNVPTVLCSTSSAKTGGRLTLTRRVVAHGDGWAVTMRGGFTLKHKLSTLVSARRMGATNSSSVGRVRLDGVSIGPGRPHHRFSPITLRRLTSSVTRVNVVRPVALHRLDRSSCRVVTKRHHCHTSVRTKLGSVPTCVHATSSRGMVRVTLVRGVRHRSLGSLRVTLTCRRLLRRCTLARRQLDRHMKGGHAAVTGCLHLLGLPTRVRMTLGGHRVSVKRTHTLLSLSSPGARVHVFGRVRSRNCSIHGIRRVIGTLDDNRAISDNKGGVGPGNSGLSRRCALLRDRLYKFFNSGMRLSYATGKGNGVDVPFGGRRSLRQVVRVLSSLGGGRWDIVAALGEEASACGLFAFLLLYLVVTKDVGIRTRGTHGHHVNVGASSVVRIGSSLIVSDLGLLRRQRGVRGVRTPISATTLIHGGSSVRGTVTTRAGPQFVPGSGHTV